MQRLIGLSALGIAIAASIGCDARVGEDYRGEVLFRMKGSLVLEEGQLAPDSVPALAFPDFKGQGGMRILDVEAHGEFPASFTIDVMSPPPAEVLVTYPGLPRFASGLITAVPEDHPAEIGASPGTDGGGRTWCENPDNTDCYRRIDICNTGTDECYHELARCTPMEWPDTMGPWCEEVDEILEQSGDPSIWYWGAKFAGMSLDYALLYIESSAPAGSARKYVEQALEADRPATPAWVFDNDEVIPAGYHLIHRREWNETGNAGAAACVEETDRSILREYNQAHGTNFERLADLETHLLEGVDTPHLDPEYAPLLKKVVLGRYDAGCDGGVYERVDPYANPITVTLGVRNEWVSPP